MAIEMEESSGKEESRVGAWLLEVAGRVFCVGGVPWDHVVGLEELLSNCVRKWVGRMVCNQGRVSIQQGSMVAAGCRALAR